MAEELPLAVGVDFANVRLLDTDGMLHLVAASGCTSMEIRKRAFDPLKVRDVQEMLVSGGHGAVARSLGIEYVEVAWIRSAHRLRGSLALGSRTKRRPTDGGIALLNRTASELAARVPDVELTSAELVACSLALVRRFTPEPWPADGPATRLRPRERAILELYADGLTTSEIATMLVISPHTIRTHVKLALRRLGVHARDEAATIVRADQLAQLL